MILLVAIDLVITLGLVGVGLLLDVVAILAGAPEWILWLIPTWFGCSMPLFRFWVGYPSSRPRRRPDHAQRQSPLTGEGRENRLEDLYP